MLRVASAATLLMLVAACGGSGDERIDAALAGDDVSPMAALFGISLDDDPSAAAAQAEDEIADCMARAGFDYTPIPIRSTAASAGFSIPTRAEVESGGYGVSESVARRLDISSEPDPNEAYVEGLSVDELREYQAALTGVTDDEIVFDDEGVPVDAVSGEPVTADQIREASSDGCAARAYAELADSNAERLLASDVWVEAQQRVQGDPEMRSLMNDWVRCMAVEGWPVTSQSDLIAGLDDGANEIFAAAASGATDAEVSTLLDELRAREVQVALVDYECSEQLFEAAPEITRRVESEYIRNNEARLIELLDATG